MTTCILVILALGIQSCSKEENEGEKVIKAKSITTQYTNETIQTGDEMQLKAEIVPEDATDKTLIWKSSDSKIASISDQGLVLGIAAGKVTITISTSNNVSTNFELTVEKKVVNITSLELDPEAVTLKIGASQKLTATILPANATEASIKWESSDEAIVTVDEAGNITAKKEGVATVSITACSTNCIKATCRVTVEKDHQAGMADALINGSFILPLNDNAITLPESEQTEMEKKIDKFLKDAKASLPFAANIYLVTNYSDYNNPATKLGNGLLIFSEMETGNIFIPLVLTKKSEDEVTIKFEGTETHNLTSDLATKVMTNANIIKIKEALSEEEGFVVDYKKVSDLVQTFRLTSNKDNTMFWNFFNEVW